MADWLLYEHDDGRHAVAPNADAATFAHADPAWHRVGPVEVPDGLSRALQIVGAEIARAEALLNVEDGGRPVFDQAQTEAGIAALRTVAAAIDRARTAGVPASSTGLTLDANDTRFLAARLRRLFAHFKVAVPDGADDARLIGNAAAGIGLLLTAQPAGVPVGDCTEPNRAACPRKCMDFCNKTEQAAAESRGDDAELERARGVSIPRHQPPSGTDATTGERG